MPLLTAEFIIPYTKEEITSPNIKQAVYKEFLCKLLHTLSPTHIDSVTCIKSYVSKHAPAHEHEKKLECIKIIAPNSIENDFKNLLLKGIPYKNRIIYAFQNSDVYSNSYPKQFTLKFRNLPHFLEDGEIVEACNLQEYKISKLRHQRVRISDDIEAFTGICYAEIEIANHCQLENIKSWNQQAFLNQFVTNEIPFKCYIQTLLQCENCNEGKRQFMGHHKKQCKHHSTQKNNLSNEDTEPIPSEEEEESADEPENKATKVDPDFAFLPFYLDVDNEIIQTVNRMESKYPKLAECDHKGGDINIINDKKVVVNQLRYVQKLSESAQQEMFEDKEWRSRTSSSKIANYNAFKYIKGRLDAFFYKPENIIYLVNLQGKVRYDFIPFEKQD